MKTSAADHVESRTRRRKPGGTRGTGLPGRPMTRKPQRGRSRTAAALLAPLCLCAALGPHALTARGDSGTPQVGAIEPLPEPDRAGERPFESLLQQRHSQRSFESEPLNDATVGQLLWATGGTTFTDRFTHRTIPSAGALYPLELYLITAQGIARYDPESHALVWLEEGDRRNDLSSAALGQRWVAEAPAIVLIAAEPARTKVKYGDRGDRYVLMEAGFACQNLLLQATVLDLAAVPVGAFRDERVREVVSLPQGQKPLLIVPVGRP